MTRGRKKDLTIPPSRSLTQQRDYRARRAQYVSDLEEKCRALESENEVLREEIRGLRVKLPSTVVHNPDVLDSSSKLMQDLTTASQSLSRFQNMVFGDAEPPTTPSPAMSDASPPALFSQPHPEENSHRTVQTAPKFPRDFLCRIGNTSPTPYSSELPNERDRSTEGSEDQ